MKACCPGQSGFYIILTVANANALRAQNCDVYVAFQRILCQFPCFALIEEMRLSMDLTSSFRSNAPHIKFGTPSTPKLN